MEGSHEGCNERLVVFDKEGLESKQELVDVGELYDSLPCNLVDVRSRARKEKERQTTKMSSKSLTKDHLTA